MRKKIIVIGIMLLAIVLLTVFTMPGQIKLSHARHFANTQNEFIQTSIKKGEEPTKVRAIVQARITEETQGNTDFEFTNYKVIIDEKKKACRIDVEIAYGKNYKKFSTQVLKY